MWMNEVLVKSGFACCSRPRKTICLGANLTVEHEMEVPRQAAVAVIGAGPAGLVVAHELLKAGHNVTVFEAGSAIGGAWQFDSSTDSDLLGLHPKRHKVHSSMYQGLRANLPRHLMTFLDFPFLPAGMGDRSHDPRVYPLHTEILAYLEAFADRFELRKHVQLDTKVLRIDPIPAAAAAAKSAAGVTSHSSVNESQDCLCTGEHCLNSSAVPLQQQQQQQQWSGSASNAISSVKWRVVTESTAEAQQHAAANGHMEQQQQQQQQQPQQHDNVNGHIIQQQQQEWVFDAVASCVGIFSEPNLPKVPGMSSWPGLQVHSHNYRDPKTFEGMKVLLVGASFSGEEIARHIAREARHVYHSARTFTGPGTAREHPHQQHQHQQYQGALDPCSSVANATASNQQHGAVQAADSKPQQQQQLPAANEPRANITRVPMLLELLPDGSAVLQGGQVLQGLDAVVYCTGYQHAYPWLEHLGIIQSGDMHVRPLYMHMFPPAYAPSLSFIGLPWRCAKMPQFQLQGQLLARLLSGRAKLPSQATMQQDQQHLFAAMSAAGIPRRYTHCLAGFMPQDEWQYAHQLALLAGAAASKSETHGGQDVPQQTCTAKVANASCHELDRGVYFQMEDRQHLQQEQAAEQEQMISAADCACSLQTAENAVRQQLLVMPEWLQILGKAAAGSILGRPDTFRDQWSSEFDKVLQAAEQEMLKLL